MDCVFFQRYFSSGTLYAYFMVASVALKAEEGTTLNQLRVKLNWSQTKDQQGPARTL